MTFDVAFEPVPALHEALGEGHMIWPIFEASSIEDAAARAIEELSELGGDRYDWTPILVRPEGSDDWTQVDGALIRHQLDFLKISFVGQK